MTGNLTWYLARSAGVVAWFLAAIALVWGLLASTRILGSRPRAAWLVDLHRQLSGLTVVFTVIHAGAVVLDDHVEFGLVDAVVPFASSWRPGAVAWGIVAAYILVAIEVTSRLRPVVPPRLWRWVHAGSPLLLVTASAHALSAGTDVTNPMLLGAAVMVSVVGTGLAYWRVRHGRVHAREWLPQADVSPDQAVSSVSSTTIAGPTGG